MCRLPVYIFIHHSYVPVNRAPSVCYRLTCAVIVPLSTSASRDQLLQGIRITLTLQPFWAKGLHEHDATNGRNEYLKEKGLQVNL